MSGNIMTQLSFYPRVSLLDSRIHLGRVGLKSYSAASWRYIGGWAYLGNWGFDSTHWKPCYRYLLSRMQACWIIVHIEAVE